MKRIIIESTSTERNNALTEQHPPSYNKSFIIINLCIPLLPAMSNETEVESFVLALIRSNILQTLDPTSE